MNKNKKMLAVLSVPAMASLLAVAVSTPAKAATRDFYDTTTTPVTTYANADYTTNADTLSKLITAAADHPSSFVYEYANSFYNYNTLATNYFADKTATTTVADAFAAAVKATPTVANPIITVASVSPISTSTTAGTAATLPSTVQVTLSDGTTKTANITWSAAATAAATYANAGTITVNGTLADYNNYAVSATVTVNPAQLAVTSVNAINASEIKVTFNKAVDATTAENTANYTLTNSGTAAIDSATTPVLSSDAKSVTLKLSAPLANTNTYSVNVQNVLSADNYAAVTSYTDTTKLFYDVTAPSLLNATYDGTNVILTFNKPLASGTIKVDGGSTVAGTVSTGIGTYKLTVAAAGLSAGTHTVTVYGATDTAGNSLSVATTTFTTVANTTTPAVTSISQYDYKTLKVTFNTPIQASLGVTNFVISKAGYVIPNTNYTVSQDTADDSTGKTWLVSFAPAALSDATNPLYATNQSSVTLNVTAENFQGTNNYYGTTYSGNVVLSKTTAAPYAVSSNLNKVATNVLKVKFNTALASANSSYITVKDSSNIIQSVASVAVDPTDSDYLDITLTAAAAPSDVLTVVLQPNAVLDPLGNTNVATTTTVDNSSSVTKIQPASVTPSGTNSNVITVAYPVAMADNAALASSYTLDGVALPSGTTIGFYGDRKTVQITLPAGYVPTNTSSLLSISTGVQSYDGASVVETAAGSAYTSMVSLIDNVKPKLTAAQYVLTNATDTTSNTITLTFSEGLAVESASDTTVEDDFAVYVNGVKATVANSAVASGAKTITLTTATPFSVNQPITVTTVSGSDSTNADGVTVADVNGNTLTSGTTLTVTK